MVMLHILVLWFFLILFLSLLSFYLRRQIRGEWCGLCVVLLLLLHSDVIWFYHGLNSAAAMLLIIIALLHTSLILALVFMVVWLVFLLKGLCRKLVLCALVSCWYTCFVYAQILFCMIFQVQKQQHKQTRDLSSSNRGRFWTRCFDVSKSKRKAWRPCCWVCVCCLVVWNLLIHSLRSSNFTWIFNLLKRLVF